MFCEIIAEHGNNLDGMRYKIYSARKINKDEFFFIANKDSFYAHGETLKKAIGDLQFKLVAEKLKKDLTRLNLTHWIIWLRKTLRTVCFNFLFISGQVVGVKGGRTE